MAERGDLFIFRTEVGVYWTASAHSCRGLISVSAVGVGRKVVRLRELLDDIVTVEP